MKRTFWFLAGVGTTLGVLHKVDQTKENLNPEKFGAMAASSRNIMPSFGGSTPIESSTASTEAHEWAMGQMPHIRDVASGANSIGLLIRNFSKFLTGVMLK
jgi:hypothetical protein